MSLARVQAELAPPFQQASVGLAAAGRWKQTPSLYVREGDDGIDGLRRAYGRPLVMLIGLAALILALSCANIANLLLARATARRREMAVRLSIGAGRARVVRQLVTESLALSFVGGAIGVGVAIWTQQWVTALVTTQGLAPFAVRAGLNANVLAVAIGLSVLTGLLFGLAPALQAIGGTMMPALREARAQTSYGWRNATGRRILLIAQVAITLEGTLSREILLAKLCAALAFLALTIAVVGLYGTVLQDVSRRRSEIGIRMALGAQRAQVIGMVLREVLVVVAIGIAMGVPAAASATGIAQAVLFGVTRSDPLTLALATGLLVTTALVAGFVPASAAARVNPTVALRE